MLTLNVNLSISIPIKLSEKIFGCITLLLNNNSYVIGDAYRNTDRITSPEKNPQRVQNNSMVKWHEITLPIIIIIAQFPQQLKPPCAKPPHFTRHGEITICHCRPISAERINAIANDSWDAQALSTGVRILQFISISRYWNINENSIQAKREK